MCSLCALLLGGIDKRRVDIDMISAQLTHTELSAKTGKGVDTLLETLVAMSELTEFTGRRARRAYRGTGRPLRRQGGASAHRAASPPTGQLPLPGRRLRPVGAAYREAPPPKGRIHRPRGGSYRAALPPTGRLPPHTGPNGGSTKTAGDAGHLPPMEVSSAIQGTSGHPQDLSGEPHPKRRDTP